MWLPVRVAAESSLRVEGEGAALELEARRDGDVVALELSGRAELALRFVSPRATEVEATGAVSAVRQEQNEGRS